MGWFLFAPLFGSLLVVSGIASRRQTAEIKSNYTTLAGRYQELDQHDPYSDVVIGAAGNPYLSKDQMRVIVRTSRAEHRADRARLRSAQKTAE